MCSHRGCRVQSVQPLLGAQQLTTAVCCDPRFREEQRHVVTELLLTRNYVTVLGLRSRSWQGQSLRMHIMPAMQTGLGDSGLNLGQGTLTHICTRHAQEERFGALTASQLSQSVLFEGAAPTFQWGAAKEDNKIQKIPHTLPLAARSLRTALPASRSRAAHVILVTFPHAPCRRAVVR